MLVIGINAGKKSLIYRCNNIYPPPEIDYDTQDYIRIPLLINKKEYLLLIDAEDILDISDISISYTFQAVGIILIFAIDNKESFDKIKEIKGQITKTNENNQPPMILVGNKKDLETERKISYDEAKNMAQEWGIEYIETSAKNNYNCKEVFHKIAKLALDYKNKKNKTEKKKQIHHCSIY